MAHFSVKQRKPFKKSFCPSRRHRRQTASRCLANFYSPFPKLSESFLMAVISSNAAALRRTAAVVRNRRDVADQHDVQSGGSQRAHGGLASGAGTLHPNFHALHPVLVARHARGSQRGLLRGVRRALARALEADRTRRGPAHDAAIRVRDGNLRIVERRRDVHHAVWNNTALALLLEFFFALRCCWRFSRGYCRVRRCILLLLFGHDSLHSSKYLKTLTAGKVGASSRIPKNHQPFLPRTFFFAATAPRRGPLRVRALVWVRWPRTGKFRRCRIPR